MDIKDSVAEVLSSWQIDKVISAKKIYYTGSVFLIDTISGKKYVLKEKRDISYVQQEYRLLESLKSAGIPVSVPILNMRRECYSKINNKNFCLYTYLPGGTMTHYYSKDAEEWAKAYGHTIAKLHMAMKKCDTIEGFREMDLFNEIFNDSFDIIRQNAEAKDVRQMESILEVLEAGLKPLYRQLPVQLIHKDMHPANMLFDKNRTLHGIIDFESVERGIRLFDLCYCCAYILIGGFRYPEKRQQWFSLVSSFLKSYNGINHLLKVEIHAFWYILLTTLFFFTAAFYKVWNMDLAKKTQEVIFWVYQNKHEINKAVLIL